MSRLPPIIGITGKAGAGKDTLAAHLVTKYNYHRRAFADPIKELLNERFGWEMSQWDDREWKEQPNSIYGCRWRGSEDGKFGRAGIEFFETFSPRSWAQWLGTEVGRNTFGQDCWVRAMERWYYGWLDAQNQDHLNVNVDAPGLVIPDVRFTNEAEWIESMGGKIIEVVREGLDPVAAHISEAGIDRKLINYTLYNHDGIPELLSTADALMREIP